MEKKLKYKLTSFRDVTTPITSDITKDLNEAFYGDDSSKKSRQIYASRNCSEHAKIDALSLEQLGTNILIGSLSQKCVSYSLSIPSENIIKSDHAVAMMIDHDNKQVFYHDSYGKEPRKEVGDFLKELLPDYKQNINLEQQQFLEDNDQSCALLTEYNLRDMWYFRDGKKEDVRSFKSADARIDAFRLLKDFEEEIKPVSKFKISVKKTGEATPEDMIARQKATKDDFEYRMYNEKDYDQKIINSAKKSKDNYLEYIVSMQKNKTK